MDRPAFFTSCIDYSVRISKIHKSIAIKTKATTKNEADIFTSRNLVELNDVLSVVMVKDYHTVKVL
jgi:hypothetical protein